MILSRAKNRAIHAFINRGIFRHALEERLKRDLLEQRPKLEDQVVAAGHSAAR